MSSRIPRGAYWGALGLLLVATGAAATAGAIASVRAADFYQQLTKPPWAPPAAVFGPVWTALYLLMAGAAWLVIRTSGWPGARPAIALYLVQLVFNALWTWIFFRWRSGGLALLEILVLWTLLLVTIRVFWRSRRLAGVMLMPYLAWVTFATALTYALWQRNPTVL
ncbi:MAG TPA: TspO/MBR family protein [Gemmatimonadales bacterium]|nr:TspO/MBR family protein [Gemmatimonadales bacterium]